LAQRTHHLFVFVHGGGEPPVARSGRQSPVCWPSAPPLASRYTMRSLAVASLLALAACQQRPAPADDRAPPPVARTTEAPRRVEIRNARAQIRTSLSRPLPAPKRMKDSQCADLGSLGED